MASSEQIYIDWRSSLKSPDDSIFYYHPDLERILLGLSVFTISSRPLLRAIGEDSVSLLNIYATDLITAWIDEDDDAFETMFQLTLTVAEAYIPCLLAIEKKRPSKKRTLRKLAAFFGYAVASGGDMTPALAQSLLEDLSTDGKELYSPLIQRHGSEILKLLQIHGIYTPPHILDRLNGW